MDYLTVYLMVGKAILLLPVTWGTIISLILVYLFERNKNTGYLWRNARSSWEEW